MILKVFDWLNHTLFDEKQTLNQIIEKQIQFNRAKKNDYQIERQEYDIKLKNIFCELEKHENSKTGNEQRIKSLLKNQNRAEIAVDRYDTLMTNCDALIWKLENLRDNQEFQHDISIFAYVMKQANVSMNLETYESQIKQFEKLDKKEVWKTQARLEATSKMMKSIDPMKPDLTCEEEDMIIATKYRDRFESDLNCMKIPYMKIEMAEEILLLKDVEPNQTMFDSLKKQFNK